MKNQNLSRHGQPRTRTRTFMLLKDGKPRTVAQLAVELRLTDAPVYCALRELRGSNEVRICSWNMSEINGRFISVWTVGSAPDEPKPPRAAWKKPDLSEDEHAKRVAAELARPAFRHWQDAALFGEARK